MSFFKTLLGFFLQLFNRSSAKTIEQTPAQLQTETPVVMKSSTADLSSVLQSVISNSDDKTEESVDSFSSPLATLINATANDTTLGADVVATDPVETTIEAVKKKTSV